MDAVADAVGKDIEKPQFYYADVSQQNKYYCQACNSFKTVSESMATAHLAAR